MIKPVQYQRALVGKSKGHVITFNDGRDYVVKFAQSGCGKVLPNEWIAYCLARFMNLPIPYSRLVQVPRDFLTQVPDGTHLLHSETQFASLYIPNCVGLHEVTDVAAVVNHASLAGIIVLDYWLGNRDRNRNNILLRIEQADSYRLWMIDQGDIFEACNWTLERLNNLSTQVYKSTAHRQMAQFVQSEQEFKEYLRLIGTIPTLLLEEIVDAIPSDWPLSAEEKRAIVPTLVSRRDKQLTPMIHQFAKKIYRPMHMNHITRGINLSSRFT